MLGRIERRLYQRVSGNGTNYGYRPGVVFDTLRHMSVWRSAWWSWRVGGRVLVDRSARLRVAKDATVDIPRGATLVIGFEPLGRPSLLEVFPRAVLELEGSFTLMGGARIRLLHEARCRLGDRTYVNADSVVLCKTDVRLGRRCAISWNVTIADTDGHTLERDRDVVADQTVDIGDDVWIGAGAIVTKGVRIGDGAVVAAGSVVTREVDPHSLVAGNPARVLAEGVSWRH